MRKSVDNMLQELYNIDKNNNYTFRFYGGKTWEIRNKKTGEGLYTDGGFSSVKKWLLKDMKKVETGENYHFSNIENDIVMICNKSIPCCGCSKMETCTLEKL